MVRKAQLDALGQQRREAFVTKLVDLIRLDFPQKAGSLEPEALEGLVERAIDFARVNHIGSEGAVIAFVGLWLEYGEGFHAIPDRAWAESLLAHPTLPDTLKVAMVRDRLMSRVQGRTIEVHVGQGTQSGPVRDEAGT
jgi:hypothetical protein